MGSPTSMNVWSPKNTFEFTLNHELEKLRAELKHDIDKVQVNLEQVKAELKHELETTKTELKRDIKEMEQKLTIKLGITVLSGLDKLF